MESIPPRRQWTNLPHNIQYMTAALQRSQLMAYKWLTVSCLFVIMWHLEEQRTWRHERHIFSSSNYWLSLSEITAWLEHFKCIISANISDLVLTVTIFYLIFLIVKTPLKHKLMKNSLLFKAIIIGAQFIYSHCLVYSRSAY